MSNDSRPLGPLVYQSFIIVLTLIVIALGVSYYNSNQNVIAQTSTINLLNAKVNSTTLENTKLQNEVTTLTTDKNTLQTQLSTLTNETASLKSQLVQISANVTTLTEKVKDLSTQLGAKNVELGNLTTANIDLRSQVASLNTQISTLQSQLSNQTSIVNMEKYVVLENNKQLTIPVNTSSYLTYKTSFAGYIGVIFTTTSGVSFDMGSTQATDTWFGTYPRTGTAVTGTFKVPAMPGTTFIKITNPSMTNEAIMYIYLTYVY
jgi:cell division protein FtsB